MVIHCKIGTMPGKYLRVRRINRALNKGDIIYGIPLMEYEKYKYVRKWKRYRVTDFWIDDFEIFYFLSR